MTFFKKTCIRLLDFVDDKLLKHRWYWLCDKIANSDWWETK
jgi:hypothetical protein